jgi:hypothetical protein
MYSFKVLFIVPFLRCNSFNLYLIALYGRLLNTILKYDTNMKFYKFSTLMIMMIIDACF